MSERSGATRDEVLYRALLDLLMVVGNEATAMVYGTPLNLAFSKASDVLRDNENFAP